MGWATLLWKDCLCIAGHCWVSDIFFCSVGEWNKQEHNWELLQNDSFYFAWENWAVLSLSPFHPNHCILMEKHLIPCYSECVKRSLLKNCLFASNGKAPVLVMSWLSIAVWYSVFLQFWLQLISYLLWRTGIVAFWPFFLLLCVLLYIWCISTFHNRYLSRSAYQRQNSVLAFELLSWVHFCFNDGSIL